MDDIIKRVYDDLSDELKALNELILKHIASRENLVTTISEYLISAGGKRIRPILTILTAKMCDLHNSQLSLLENSYHIKLGAAVEFIHTATLLHDDVIDGVAYRRRKTTVNNIWGNKASILIGDYLFSQAFKLIVEVSSTAALSSLAKASTVIAEGEIMQLAKLNRLEILDIEEYFDIISAKTAELFGSACEVGAIITCRSNNLISSTMRQFGFLLGQIFQINDDYLDYFGNYRLLGKEIGAYFYEGQYTIPLNLLYNKLNCLQKNKIAATIHSTSKSSQDLKEILILMKKYDIESNVEEYINKLKIRAKLCLESLNINNNIYYNHLFELINFVALRNY